MSDLTIQQFRYFLEDLEKNLSRMDYLVEQMSVIIDNSHYSYKSMSEICRNWSKLLEQKK